MAIFLLVILLIIALLAMSEAGGKYEIQAFVVYFLCAIVAAAIINHTF